MGTTSHRHHSAGPAHHHLPFDDGEAKTQSRGVAQASPLRIAGYKCMAGREQKCNRYKSCDSSLW